MPAPAPRPAAVPRAPSLSAYCPHGFTLLEVLGVMSILAVLFGLSLGLVRAGAERSAMARARAELAVLAAGLENVRRHYGDYPAAGATAPGAHRVGAGDGPGVASPAAILFNALTGASGPSGVSAGAINGPMFVDASRLTAEVPLDPLSFGVPAGSPPVKPIVNNAWLDPWGNRYVYWHRPVSNAAGERGGRYVLLSAGPDGLIDHLPGIGATPAETVSPADADNVYAGFMP